LNIYAFEYRGYDPALGSWLQVDPKASERESPYVGMANNPILYADPLGDTIRIYANNKAGEQFIYAQVNTVHVAENVNLDLEFDNTNYKTQTIDLDKNLKSLLETTDATIDELDAFVVDLNAAFSFGGGAELGLEYVYFLSGKDKGGHLFGYSGGNLGFDLGAGLEAGIGLFNENSGESLGIQTYEGLSQGVSVGVSTFSATYSFSNVDNDQAPWTNSQRTWQTATVGGGISKIHAGARWFWNHNKHLKKLY
jgi:hypothetical protein